MSRDMIRMSSSLLSEEVPLALPAPLRAVLEDDCFWILRRDKLVSLPAKPTVENLLKDFFFTYLDGAPEETNLQLVSEVLDGIKIYFDFTLADHLLYGPEKEQHRSLGIINPVLPKKTSSRHGQSAGDEVNATGNDSESNHRTTNRSLPSQVYGAIHLLRLFVKMPQFLSSAQLPPGHVQILHTHFRDLLSYISSKRQELFLEEHYNETVEHPVLTNNHDTDVPPPPPLETQTTAQ